MAGRSPAVISFLALALLLVSASSCTNGLKKCTCRPSGSPLGGNIDREEPVRLDPALGELNVPPEIE